MSQIPGEKARLAYLGPCGHPLPNGGREQFILTESCVRIRWHGRGVVLQRETETFIRRKGKGYWQAETVDAP